MVEELVKTFQAARGDVLAMGWAIRDGALEEMERGKKRKLSEIDTADIHSNGPSPRKTRSQTHHRSRVVSNSEEPEEHNGVQNITEENQTGI